MDYEVDDFPSDNSHIRDALRDPSAKTLWRARGKLDAVSMLLDRREFAGWKATDAVRGISLYSDASPVVGTELQGMVMDVVFHPGRGPDGNELCRRTLPGSSLPYGMTDWSAKLMALVWAIFLVVGPGLEEMSYFWTHVRSLTTDYGVELSLQMVCDIIPAFILWVLRKVMEGYILYPRAPSFCNLGAKMDQDSASAKMGQLETDRASR
jgi:hypothetical protein